MNKKIAIPAAVCILLQLICLLFYLLGLFPVSVRLISVLILSVFHLIAIPYALYHLFTISNGAKPYKNIRNIIGVFCTLPFLLLYVYISISRFQPKEEEIDPEAIHLYNDQGEEIPIDSIADSTFNISKIKIDEDVK